MPSTEPPCARQRREGLRTAWIVLLSMLTILPLAEWRETREPHGPVELVEAFFQAIRDKDLDEAFSYTDASIPVGEAAAFLHPDAVGDEWEVLEVTADEGDSSSETVVRVTIGHPGGTASGRYVVREFDQDMSIKDPFRSVVFATSPQLELRVNDRVIGRRLEYRGSVLAESPRYELLPGVYRFFGGEPVALLGPEADEAPVIPVPAPEPTRAQLEAVQAAVADRIDACVEYKVVAPPGCPFSTDGNVDTTDRERLRTIEAPVWTVSAYPETTVTPGIDMWGNPALLVEYLEPGRLELRGIGSADDEHWKEFTAACHFGGGELAVLLHGDGGIELAPIGAPEDDTCRGTA